MRLHVPALPHTSLTREFAWCAYTGKLRNFPGLLERCGHEAVTYGDFTADVEVVTAADRERWFGAPEWDREVVFDHWDPDAPCWTEMADRTAHAILDRWEPGDAVALIAGRCQERIVARVAAVYPNPLTLEWGVGYDGILPASHCAFESTAWRHHVYGLRGITDGRAFDAVIPNSFDPDDFTQLPSDGYLLFIGRHTERKGLAVVRELARRYETVTAGQNGPLGQIAYAGIVTGDAKAKLFAGARAVLVPTSYVEPFGGVAVEAMMSGVPVICSDWGAFTETVRDGTDGYRCSTLADYLDAVEQIDGLDRTQIAVDARARFSLDAVAPMYAKWLDRCDQLHGDGWYAVPDRSNKGQ